MAEYLIQGETLTDIADAIRAKLGINAAIAVSNMASSIRIIPVDSGSGDDGGSGSGGSDSTGSTVESGPAEWLGSDSKEIEIECSFVPSKLVIYAWNAKSPSYINFLVYTDEMFTVGFFDFEGTFMLNTTSVDDGYYYVNSSGSNIVVGVSDKMNVKFASNTTYNYIAIA